MVAAFLKAEISSFRFGKDVLGLLASDKKDRITIEQPDLNNQSENEYRKSVLARYRGYGQDLYLFSGFPKSVTWFRAIFDQADFNKLKYIDYDYWNELSDKTSLVVNGANNVRKGVEIFGESNKNFWEVHTAYTKGYKFPPLIITASDIKADLVLLEGHLRATAYLLDPDNLPQELEVIIGLSPDFKNGI